MAREFAQIKLSIWADDDWRDLSPLARYLYLTLLTSPTLSHCGVADWRPSRIGSLNGMATEEVEEAGDELADARYLVIDDESEEVLIRSYVRNDGLMKQPKMAVAMASAHAAVASQTIRGVIVHEAKRLREDFPELSGWGPERAKNLLGLRSVNPSTLPSRKGSIKGSGKGKATPSGKGSPTPTPAPTPTPSSLAPVLFDASSPTGADPDSATDKSVASTRKKPATRIPDDWRPTETHWEKRHDAIDVDTEAKKFRLHAEANDRRQVNWNAAFSQWLLNARPTPGNVTHLRPPPGVEIPEGAVPLPPLPARGFFDQ